MASNNNVPVPERSQSGLKAEQQYLHRKTLESLTASQRYKARIIRNKTLREVGVATEMRLLSVDDANEVFKVALLIHTHYRDVKSLEPDDSKPDGYERPGKSFKAFKPQITMINCVESQFEDFRTETRVNRNTGMIWTTFYNTCLLSESLEMLKFPYDRQLFRVTFKSPNSKLRPWREPSDILDLRRHPPVRPPPDGKSKLRNRPTARPRRHVARRVYDIEKNFGKPVIASQSYHYRSNDDMDNGLDHDLGPDSYIELDEDLTNKIAMTGNELPHNTVEGLKGLNSEANAPYLVACELKHWFMSNFIVTYFPEDDDPASLTQGEFQITILAERDPKFYFFNFFLVIYIIVLTNVACVSIQVMESGDRNSVSLTLLLTLVAFKFVLMEGTPKVGYLTYMDRYVVISYGFIAIAVLENILISPTIQCLLSRADDYECGSDGLQAIAENSLTRTIDISFHCGYALIWTLWNILVAMTCYWPWMVRDRWLTVLESQIGETEETVMRTSKVLNAMTKRMEVAQSNEVLCGVINSKINYTKELAELNAVVEEEVNKDAIERSQKSRQPSAGDVSSSPESSPFGTTVQVSAFPDQTL